MLICIIFNITAMAPSAANSFVPTIEITNVSTSVINIFIKLSKAIGNDIFNCDLTFTISSITHSIKKY